MPTPPTGLGSVVRNAARPARIKFSAPYRSFVPRLLDERGVARYEPETMAAFLAAISVLESTDAFDIGANVGIFSIVAGSTTTARLTGFEPTPDVADTFRSVVAANALDCNIEAIAPRGDHRDGDALPVQQVRKLKLVEGGIPDRVGNRRSPGRATR